MSHSIDIVEKEYDFKDIKLYTLAGFEAINKREDSKFFDIEVDGDRKKVLVRRFEYA